MARAVTSVRMDSGMYRGEVLVSREDGEEEEELEERGFEETGRRGKGSVQIRGGVEEEEFF